MKNQKGFAQILIFIFLVVILIVVFYFYKQSSGPNLQNYSGKTTTDSKTKTYKDTELGFQFEYNNSSGIFYDGLDSSNLRYIVLKDPSLSLGQKYNDENYFSLTASKMGQYKFSTCTGENINKSPNYKVKAVDYPVIKKIISLDGAENTHALHACASNNGTDYYLSAHYNLNGTNKENVESRFNTILSTFIFTK